MNIKEIFDKAEGGTLTFEQFDSIAKNGNAKFADLSEGGYVSKSKYDDELASKDKAITQLNDTISQRDKDLADLQTKLKDAGTDTTKLSELQTSFDELQDKYTADTKAYEQQLATQKYEFAVKEYANGKEFTSHAAKRDFIRSLIDENLKMKGDSIVGADDFASAYAQDNADAFVVKAEVPEQPTQPTAPEVGKPQFVGTTPGTEPAKAPSLTDMMKAANESAGAKSY